jgi:hypothetical protein
MAFRIGLLASLAMLLSACGGGSSSDGSPPAATGPDQTPPTIVSTFPAPGATGVALNAVLSITASEPVDPATLNGASFTLAAVGGPSIPGIIAITSTTTATFTPVVSLQPSTQYTATITTGVKDSAGNALATAFAWSFTTVTVPGAPTAASATAGNAQASVSFTPPASNGGATITSYTVTSTPGGISASGGASPIVVPGLINGTPYTFTVTATNSIGTGAPSAPSNSVTPSLGAAVPSAPVAASAVGGNGQATVTVTTPPASPGVPAVILGYVVTSSPGGISASGAGPSIVVPGLTNGTAYTFSVAAFNASGSGAAFVPTNSVTPAGLPGAPTTAVASAGNASATVTFSAPASNGGSAITGYTVTSNPGGGVDANAGSPSLTHTITGLSNGTRLTRSRLRRLTVSAPVQHRRRPTA